jgi:hypothetical protein
MIAEYISIFMTSSSVSCGVKSPTIAKQEQHKLEKIHLKSPTRGGGGAMNRIC